MLSPSFYNFLYATLPTNVVGSESLNSYSYGQEYFAKLLSQYFLIFFLVIALGFSSSFKTIYAFTTCFLYGCGIPTTTHVSTKGHLLIISST